MTAGGAGFAWNPTTGRWEASNSSYAPLDSPSFTGNPQTITPPGGDNDLSIANTAWVTALVASAVGTPQQTGGLAADMTAISAQTTLQDMTGIAVAIGASATEIWLAKFWVIMSAANGTMDAKLGFSVPAGCTMRWGMNTLANQTLNGGWGALSVASIPNAAPTESTAVGFASVNGIFFASAVAVIYGGGTAGNVQLRYAQNTSDAGNLQVLKGTCYEAKRMLA